VVVVLERVREEKGKGKGVCIMVGRYNHVMSM